MPSVRGLAILLWKSYITAKSLLQKPKNVDIFPLIISYQPHNDKKIKEKDQDLNVPLR